MVEVVNIVASGDFGCEFDLEALVRDLNANQTVYEPETFAGMKVRFEPDGPVIMLYSTGTYTVLGAKSRSQLTDLHERIVTALNEIGIGIQAEESFPEIKNLVCKGELGREVDLEALAIGLGLENIEYEPEQSPFLYYWPEDLGCLITIPTNGKISVTGVRELGEAKAAIEYLQKRVESLIGEER